MLLVLCVDLDDDLGRTGGVETPVVGREAVESAAVSLATADPEDSDVNVLFEGIHIYDTVDEPVEVAAVAGLNGGDVAANRRVGAELDAVLTSLDATDVRTVVVTDGAQDESVLPVIRSRVTVDGVRRVVVRQAADLESMYYTIKQVLDDPETRGTILVPLGVLLLIYPLALAADYLGLPGAVLGITSALFGLYALARGLGLTKWILEAAERAREGLYAGRVTLITYVVAAMLLIVGGFQAVEELAVVRRATPDPSMGHVLAALVHGGVIWFAAAGVTSSLGQITDEYLADEFRWRYCNAPFYVIAIATVLFGTSQFFLGRAALPFLAGALTFGALLGVLSTLTFAVIESYRDEDEAAGEDVRPA